jgi:hypothetical protein
VNVVSDDFLVAIMISWYSQIGTCWCWYCVSKWWLMVVIDRGNMSRGVRTWPSMRKLPVIHIVDHGLGSSSTSPTTALWSEI